MLRYLTVPVTAFAQNCSIVWCDETKDAAVIDPGGDLDRLLAEVQRLGVTLKAIWLTHGHLDHAGGAAELKERTGLTIRREPHQLAQIAEAAQRITAGSGIDPADRMARGIGVHWIVALKAAERREILEDRSQAAAGSGVVGFERADNERRGIGHRRSAAGVGLG